MTSMDKYVSDRYEDSMEAFSRQKKYLSLGPWEIAYVEAGQGEPLILLHGCPFQSYEWHKVIPYFAEHYRVIAPDLLGLGDTRVTLKQDYRLPMQVEMVNRLMDALHIQDAYFIGHDHGAATLQVMMKHTPHRIRKCVLTNAEAYDQWPSAEERPYVQSIVRPWTTWAVYLALKSRRVQRDIFSIAVADPATLDEETLYAFTRPHMATWRRWQRLRHFFRWQLDIEHNLETMRALDGMKRFTAPTLILWGERDGNFGRQVAERLARDIPGAEGVHYLSRSAHLPMLEQPEEYADAVFQFLRRNP
ncbi:alpha/beta hydrolase [Candidatus Parcubacteria bacterium]|nr:MAG: alpha/beta hydrolase [Candidatus Parcubacteria bacterium]